MTLSYETLAGTLWSVEGSWMICISLNCMTYIGLQTKQRYTGIWYSAAFSTTLRVAHIWLTVWPPFWNYTGYPSAVVQWWFAVAQAESAHAPSQARWRVNIPGSVETLLTFFLWSGTTLDVPVFIKNFFCLNVGHLSTSDDVIDKMAYVTVTTGVQCRHSRNCSNGSYLKSFDIVLVFYEFEYSLMNFRGGGVLHGTCYLFPASQKCLLRILCALFPHFIDLPANVEMPGVSA